MDLLLVTLIFSTDDLYPPLASSYSIFSSSFTSQDVSRTRRKSLLLNLSNNDSLLLRLVCAYLCIRALRHRGSSP